MNEVYIGLLALVTLQGGALVYLIKKKNGSPKANGVGDLYKRIELLEHRLLDDLKDTRHALIAAYDQRTAEMLLALKEKRGR